MEKIDKAIEIIQAFKEGKTIEWYADEFSKWERFNGNLNSLLLRFIDYNIRIKKETTYRPYANAEEFLKASKEHGPYVKAGDGGYIKIDRVYDDKIHWCHLNDSHMLTLKFEDFLERHTWQDGTPCGILER